MCIRDRVCAAVFLLVLLWPLHSLGTTVAYTPEERSLLEALESGEIIRLHVLADGDNAESQRVKLCVRDALIAAFGEMLLDASQADADTVYELSLIHIFSSLHRTAKRPMIPSSGSPDPAASITAKVPVSYTHLDVYKRQPLYSTGRNGSSSPSNFSMYGSNAA